MNPETIACGAYLAGVVVLLVALGYRHGSDPYSRRENDFLVVALWPIVLVGFAIYGAFRAVYLVAKWFGRRSVKKRKGVRVSGNVGL